MIAEQTQTEQSVEKAEKRHGLEGIKNNTVRIARLRLLMIAAKVVTAPIVIKSDTQSRTAEHRP